jgi:hypothetical protein
MVWDGRTMMELSLDVSTKMKLIDWLRNSIHDIVVDILFLAPPPIRF